MKVIWTDGAAADLEEIVLYIRRESHPAAQRVATIIFDAVLSLSSMPYRGRKCQSGSSRELVISSLPYLILYEVATEAILIRAIRHTARNWLRT